MFRLLAALAVAAMPACGGAHEAAVEASPESFPVQKTDAEWRALLTEQEYAVLREHATERAWTGDLLEEHRDGTYVCAGCGHPLFASATKFDSGTGWPSYYEPLPGGIGTTTDYAIGMARTEVHCANCGGHQGHVFDDGPAPTGLRYCINAVSMNFTPK